MLEKKHNNKRKIVVIALAVVAVLILLIARSCGNQEDINNDVREITVTFENLSTVYGDPLAEAKWEIKGDVEPGDEVSVTPAEFNFKDAGTYEITGTAVVKGESGVVYNVSIEPGTYTVTKRQITIEVDDKESIRGNPLEDLSGKVVGTILDGDDLGIRYQTDAKMNIPGEYKITATIENQNYEAKVKDGVYVIHSAEEEDLVTPTPTPGQTDKPDDKPDDKPGETPKPTDKPEEEKPEETPTPTPPTPTPPPEVTPKTVNITVTFTDLSSVYGNTLATAKWRVSGNMEPGDKLVVKPEKFGFKNAGTYPITGTVKVEKITDTIYNITVIDGIYTVKQRPITIKVDDKSSVEGRPLKTLTGKIVGTVVPGDDLGLKYQKAPGTAPGKYDITATISNPNYVATVEKGIYTITADTSGGDDDDDNGGGDGPGTGPGTGDEPGTGDDPGLPGNPDDEDDSDDGDDDNPDDTEDTPGTEDDPGLPGNPDDEDDSDDGDDDNPDDTEDTPGIGDDPGPVGNPDNQTSSNGTGTSNPGSTENTPGGVSDDPGVVGNPDGTQSSNGTGTSNPGSTENTPGGVSDDPGVVGNPDGTQSSNGTGTGNPGSTEDTPGGKKQEDDLDSDPTQDGDDEGGQTS